MTPDASGWCGTSLHIGCQPFICLHTCGAVHEQTATAPGLGERPDESQVTGLLGPNAGFVVLGESLNAALGINDEFGFRPSSAYVEMNAYF